MAPISTKNLDRFNFYMFGDKFDPSKELFSQIDPWVCDQLKDEEREVAKIKLLEAIKERIDKRWLYAILEMKIEEAIFVLENYLKKESDLQLQIELVKTIVGINANHPSFSIFISILKTQNNESAKLQIIYAFQLLKIKNQITQKNLEDFTDVLFESLLDLSPKIRIAAYNALIDYVYRMRNYVSKLDPIYDLLNQSNNSFNWQKARNILEDWLRSKKIEPFNLFRVKELISKVMNRPVLVLKNECKICHEIPDEIHADMAAGEGIPSFINKLDDILILGSSSNRIKRCPSCGRLYLYLYYYSYYLAGQSEEEEHLSVANSDIAIQLLESYLKSYVQPKFIITCGDFIELGY